MSPSSRGAGRLRMTLRALTPALQSVRRPRFTGRCTLCLLLLFLVVSPHARADGELAIPESCGTRGELAREANAMRAPSSAPLPPTRMRLDGQLYVLEVDLPEGRRTLRDSDCRALFRAAILISALGEGALAEQPQPAESPRPALLTSTPPPPRVNDPSGRRLREPDDDTAPAPAPAATREAARSSPLHVAGLVRASGVYGVVPKLGAELGLGAELARGRFRARLGFSMLTPSTSAREQGIAVRVYGVGAHLAAGARVSAWLELALGADLEALHGRARGALRDRPGWTALPLLHAELSLRLLERGRVRLELPLAALFAPARSRFLIEGRGPVYTSERVGFRAGLRASLLFL